MARAPHRDAAEALPATGALAVDEAVAPLLAEIFRTHVELMRANHSAWHAFKTRGHNRFNEAAFDRQEALYDGVVDGHPFRSVAKSFQARVWMDCLERWNALPAGERECVARLLPEGHGLAVG